jgi:CRISPR-associated protein Cmr2
MPNKYLALTIGPIHQTLKSVKSTKAIWSASYLFSYLMRETILKLKNTEGVTFLIPFVNKVTLSNNKVVDFYDGEARGVGLFPDRFIAQISSDVTVDLNAILNTVIEDIAKKIAVKIKCDELDIIAYLQKYFQLHSISIEADFDNPIESINNYLNTLESQSAFVAEEIQSFLIAFFEDVYYNQFIETEFDKKDKRFPSTSEIATTDLGLLKANELLYNNAVSTFKTIDNIKKEKKAQELFYDDLLRGLPRLQRHKYIVVVQADGDNMGFLIQKTNDALKNKPVTERFSRISHQLLAFAYEATELIKNYGGKPIYAGGDDLLFFAPVVGADSQNILLLFERIDDLFKKLIIEDSELKSAIAECSKFGKNPTMSYGVSVSYYKFPLNESLDMALAKLFNDAKKTNEKNAISFSVMKHSGQTFGATFHKSQPSFQKFRDLVQTHLKNSNNKENFINSIAHKIQMHEGILRGIASRTVDFPTMLQNFFDNNFNEAIHNTNRTYINTVKEFVEAVFNDFPLLDTDKKLDKIYAALRYIHFVKADFKNEE